MQAGETCLTIAAVSTQVHCTRDTTKSRGTQVAVHLLPIAVLNLMGCSEASGRAAVGCWMVLSGLGQDAGARTAILKQATTAAAARHPQSAFCNFWWVF